MSVAIVTGSAGLIGAETVRFLTAQGMDVVGIDNDMRSYFFGEGASTAWATQELTSKLARYTHRDIDIRSSEEINELFSQYGANVSLVVHTAAQPSHDWAAKEPLTDFAVNANGTLNLLEATRQYCPEAVFIFTSTNKVYGDTPNYLPMVELEERWELEEGQPFREHGIDESMSIDNTLHSLFGASKVAADVLAQEYGKYFGIRTAIFRGGCLTGPGHSGAMLHGFLAYLGKCAVSGDHYTVLGYKGKQVRDNIHSRDLVNAFWHVFQNPRVGEVYNIGGGRHSNCSMLEAITLAEEFAGKPMNWSYSEDNRVGDHIWWISDVRKFQDHYPDWHYQYSMRDIMEEIIEAASGRA